MTIGYIFVLIQIFGSADLYWSLWGVLNHELGWHTSNSQMNRKQNQKCAKRSHCCRIEDLQYILKKQLCDQSDPIYNLNIDFFVSCFLLMSLTVTRYKVAPTLHSGIRLRLYTHLREHLPAGAGPSSPQNRHIEKKEISNTKGIINVIYLIQYEIHIWNPRETIQNNPKQWTKNSTTWRVYVETHTWIKIPASRRSLDRRWGFWSLCMFTHTLFYIILDYAGLFFLYSIYVLHIAWNKLHFKILLVLQTFPCFLFACFFT